METLFTGRRNRAPKTFESYDALQEFLETNKKKAEEGGWIWDSWVEEFCYDFAVYVAGALWLEDKYSLLALVP